jgi:mannosyltransferase
MDKGVNSQRRELLVLFAWCLLLMLTWGLWLWRLDASDLTFDEAATYFVAHRPLLGILDYLRGAVREHPPVYYLLIHGWMALAGSSEFSLRFFSVSAGLVALALTGWLAGLAMGRSASAARLFPAALLAVVPGMVYYARDARMYSLGIIWAVLSAGLFLRDWLLAQERPRRAAFVSLVIVHLLAIFTHYYLFLFVLVQPLVLLITRRWRSLLAWCAAHSLPAVAGLVWLWLAPGLQMTTGGVWQSLTLVVPTRFQVFHLLGKILFSPVVQVRFHLLYWLLALAGGGVLVALWHRRSAGVWLALVLVVPLALAFQVPHSPGARYLVFMVPFLALAMGFLGTALLWLRRRRLAWGATLALTLGMAYLLSSGGLGQAIAFDRSHYGRTLQTVKAHARPGDGILFYGPWQWIPFSYYDPGGLPPITSLPRYAPPRLKPAEAEPVLEELLARYDRLWVIPAAVDDVDPAHFVAGWLDEHTHPVWRTEDFGLYLPPLPPDASSQPARVAFGEVLRLESVAWQPGPVPAGEPLRLALRWSYLRRPENALRLTLSLADASGHVWDQVQTLVGEWQPGEVIVDHEGLLVPQGALPGEYTVHLMVTDDETGEPLLADGEKWISALAVQVTGPVHAPVLYGLPNPEAAAFCSPGDAHCVMLAGYEPGGLRFQQGHAVRLKLHWLVPDGTPPQVRLRLQVWHRAWPFGGRVTPIVTHTLVLPSGYATGVLSSLPDGTAGSFRTMLPIVMRAFPMPPSNLAAAGLSGRLVTLPIALMLPPDALTGPAQVTVEVLGPDGVAWPTAAGTSSCSLFNVTVESRPALRQVPAGLTPIQVDFGDEVGMRGYHVEGTPLPGGQLHLTYAWYARTRPTAIYAVFNHLTTDDGTLVAQADGWPQEGRMLTTQWQPGEYIEDSYTLAIPADAPPGPYTLYVGLYDAATNERQPAFLDGQRLPQDRVPVSLPGGNGR